MTNDERRERALRVLSGLSHDIEQAQRLLRARPDLDVEALRKAADGIAEFGGMLADVAEGREPYDARRSVTVKVRKALGFNG